MIVRALGKGRKCHIRMLQHPKDSLFYYYENLYFSNFIHVHNVFRAYYPLLSGCLFNLGGSTLLKQVLKLLEAILDHRKYC